MKKIALVSHVLPPSWSGQAIVLDRILKTFDHSQISLLSKNDYRNQSLDQNTNDQFNYCYLKPFPPLRFFRRFQFVQKSYLLLEMVYRGLQIAKIVNAEKCEIIISCTGDLLDIPAAYIAGVLTNKNVIPYYFDDYVYQWPDENTRSFARKMENRVFKRNKSAIVPNEFMRDTLFKRQAIKAAIVRNPANVLTKNDKKEPGGKSDSIRLVYTGAIYHVNYSAFRTLLSAISLINDPKIELHIFTAQSKELLEKQGISGVQLHIHTHASFEETATAQMNAHIVIIPFSFDSSVPEVIKTSAPGKLADYLSSGTPILALVPPDTFVAWFLTKHECGFVVNKDDPQILASAISELLNNDQIRVKITENAKNLAKVEFDLNKIRNTFLKVIDNDLEMKSHE